ncbi:auxin-induced in root cultures protein 12 [Citrus sinensis]|uniref:Auxin-induced in root cultures protein 12 n=1 Tax=Citrus sinensis TaxID=2711 RepID=A0ACB8LCB5_CITSI|nr:auxin-induced in root cultures protein 12 [Citrus sinensis]
MALAVVLLSIWVLLISPAHSLTCTSQRLTNNKKPYDSCLDLPTLSSYLHYTYNATNSSLSIAFVSTPASPDGWVAWAINPTAKGMAGSQALIALKSSGSLVVKTYNISSYSTLTESKLSFQTWDLKAESGANGTTVIYGKLKVPEKAETLNQVWQVGAQVANGHPMKHEFKPANLQAKGPLNLVKKPGSLTPASAPTPGTPGSPGVPSPDRGGQSMIRANVVGLFMGLVLFLVTVSAL